MDRRGETELERVALRAWRRMTSHDLADDVTAIVACRSPTRASGQTVHAYNICSNVSGYDMTLRQLKRGLAAASLDN